MGSGVPLVPIGVEAWMGEPTNVMLKGSRSWVGWGCSVEIGTSDVVGQKGEKADQSRTKDWPGRGEGSCGPSPSQLPFGVATGPAPAEGWGPEGYPRSGSDSTRLPMGLARRF